MHVYGHEHEHEHEHTLGCATQYRQGLLVGAGNHTWQRLAPHSLKQLYYPGALLLCSTKQEGSLRLQQTSHTLLKKKTSVHGLQQARDASRCASHNTVCNTVGSKQPHRCLLFAEPGASGAIFACSQGSPQSQAVLHADVVHQLLGARLQCRAVS